MVRTILQSDTAFVTTPFVTDTEAEREYPVIVPPVETVTDAECGENGFGDTVDCDSPLYNTSVFRHEESWPSKMEGPLLRKIAALRRALYLAGKERKEAENGVKILMQVCASTSSHPC